MRVLVGQISPIVGDVSGNLARCVAAVAAGREAGCDLVVLPELVLSGYPPRDLLERQDLIEACAQAAHELAAKAPAGCTVVFGAPLRDEAGLRNAAVVARDGRIVQVVHKSLLPTYDVFDESRYFVPERAPAPVRVGGQTLGITICEDIWSDGAVEGGRRYDVDPAATMAGCDVLINISASPFYVDKGAERMELVRRQAQRVGAPVVYCNAVGGNDELLFDGESLVVGADGALLHQGAAFVHQTAVVDLQGPAVQGQTLSPQEQLAKALTMGIGDYASRCGFTTAVLGLSGGIDSAVVATLAADALGSHNLMAVGLPGPFSSPGSVDDSRELCRRQGIDFSLVPINPIHDAFLSALSPSFSGMRPDVTEENLQARARGTVLMALSNKLGHLLLTTGNKSELAVGYCTLYGDMNGGLAAISDVFKTDVFRLARHLNASDERIPQAIIDKPPSAELAPDQKDEDSLPPYEELDAILRLYVEQMAEPAVIEAQGHDPNTVRRVVGLVIRNEYKRWQAAPGLKVSRRAFGVGRRIPLAQRWHHQRSGSD